MIATMLLLALQAPAAQPYTDEEIVVFGQRLRSITVNVNRNAQGMYSCSLDQSSGSGMLDERLCFAAVACAQRPRRGESIAACFERRKPQVLAELQRQLRAQSR